MNDDDRSYISVTEDINRAIKSTARVISRTRLSDKISSEIVLHKANLRCLNESVASIMAITVWKARNYMNPLGQCLFKNFQKGPSERSTRSQFSNDICLPVPGFPTVASNIMAKIWNSVPGLQSATTLGAAKAISRKWAREIHKLQYYFNFNFNLV